MTSLWDVIQRLTSVLPSDTHLVTFAVSNVHLDPGAALSFSLEGHTWITDMRCLRKHSWAPKVGIPVRRLTWQVFYPPTDIRELLFQKVL